MTDEEIKQTLREIKEQREKLFCIEEDDGLNQFMRAMPAVDKLYDVIESLSDKLTDQEKEIERLKAIEKAANEVCYYQGTEGSADRLERLLGYPEEQGK